MPKKRRETGKSVLYGITPVQQCLSHGSREAFQLLLKEGMRSARIDELIRLAQSRNVPVRRIDGSRLAGMANTKLHQGVVLSCGELRAQDLDGFLDRLPRSERQLLVAMDQVEDPQNLGAVIRSAAFLGAAGLITLKRHAAPLSAAVSKASAGALEHFPLIQVGNLSESLQRLKKEGFMVVGAAGDESAVPFNEFSPADRMVLVLGNEGEGLRQLTRKRCDALLRIPGVGTVESLNVSAAAAILIQHFTQ